MSVKPYKGFPSLSAYYRHRLITEKPKLKSGKSYKITRDGYFIEVPSTSAMNGKYACYVASDYPDLFGWDRPNVKPQPKITQPVPHTVLCEISLGWANVCDCGADKYNDSLKRQRKALANR